MFGGREVDGDHVGAGAETGALSARRLLLQRADRRDQPLGIDDPHRGDRVQRVRRRSARGAGQRRVRRRHERRCAAHVDAERLRQQNVVREALHRLARKPDDASGSDAIPEAHERADRVQPRLQFFLPAVAMQARIRRLVLQDVRVGAALLQRLVLGFGFDAESQQHLDAIVEERANFRKHVRDKACGLRDFAALKDDRVDPGIANSARRREHLLAVDV
jgi:hypothetical protein